MIGIRKPVVTGALMAAVLGLSLSAAPAAPAASGSATTLASAKRKDRQLVRMIGKMSLEEKVGQLFILQIYGRSADTTDPAVTAKNQAMYGVDNAEQLFKKYKPGGIIYYVAGYENIGDAKQVAEFSNGIQKAALAQPKKIPATVTTDQEGGIVARLGAGATQFPGAMALGAGRRTGDAFMAARITGKELRAVGINHNYAPVADVNTNPLNPVIGVRSSGSDPQLVTKMSLAQVRGYESANVTATVKHFPGHGDTAEDSHTGVTEVKHNKEEWEKYDLPPFKAAVDQGVDSIMTAHVLVKALDPAMVPSTVSKPIMTGIVRDRLRYDGLVTTDALDMKGLRYQFKDEDIPAMVMNAGVDQMEKPPEGKFDLQYNALLKAIRSGQVSEKRIDEAVYRILRVKKERGLFKNPMVDADKADDVLGNPRHLAAAQKMTDRTTTLVKNEGKTLPLPAKTGKVLVASWGAQTSDPLAKAIQAHGPSATVVETGLKPDQAKIDQAVAKAAESDAVVVTTNRAWNIKTDPPGNGPGQMNLVKALLKTGKPVVVVATRDAYDINRFPEAKTYVATYSYGEPAMKSLAGVLFGKIKPRGKLPVTIPEADKPGTVLYPFGHGLGYER